MNVLKIGYVCERDGIVIQQTNFLRYLLCKYCIETETNFLY